MKRTLLIILIGCSLGACGSDEPVKSEAADTPPEPLTAAATENSQEAEANLSVFLSDSLHPFEPATPGRFRLEVAGEVHEGQMQGRCGWLMKTSEGQNQDRFQAGANWRADDGRSMSLEIWRFVMHDEFFWNRSHGHESERVQVRLREDGGSLVNVQDTAVSEMRATRASPGDDPAWRWGSGEMPSIRVAADGRQATVSGELGGTDNEYGSPLTGPFTLAVHCAAEQG